jgi:hypothetical protein
VYPKQYPILIKKFKYVGKGIITDERKINFTSSAVGGGVKRSGKSIGKKRSDKTRKTKQKRQIRKTRR